MARSIAVEFNILDKFVLLDPAIELASFGILAQENLWTFSRRHREIYLTLTLVLEEKSWQPHQEIQQSESTMLTHQLVISLSKVIKDK